MSAKTRLLPIVLATLLLIVIAWTAVFAVPSTTQQSAPATGWDRGHPVRSSALTMAELRTALEEGTLTTSAMLADPAWMDQHMDRVFRGLMREFGTASTVTMVTPDEIGAPLIVAGRIENPAGETVEGILVYAYHTDHTGMYGNEHSGFDPTQRNRLFGYCTTGPDGAFKLITVRPASYPNSTNPQHIHFEFSGPGYRSRWAEIMFADDPLLTGKGDRETAERQGNVVVDVAANAEGIPTATVTFVVEPIAG